MKPFFGGTYFPPARAFNRSSWKEVIIGVASAYRNKKKEIEEQAETLVKHLVEANNLQNGGGMIELASEQASLQAIVDNLLRTADKEWGGFGNPPKFPHTFSILYLLRHYHFSGHKPSLDHALLSLDKLMMGGIYDQLGGGFARYATDRRWQVPHFEKMLYDNALLLEAFTEAYQLTKKKEYGDVIHDTIGFLQREMMSPEGGFYSALDADSEGIEGKYYTWDINEVKALLADDSEIFCKVFDVSDSGNWEQTNILWMPQSRQKFSEVQNDETLARLEESRAKLFAARQKRVRPGLDDKVVLCWNALMIKSLCKAYAATGGQEYRQLAEMNISFLEKNLQKNNSSIFFHSWNKKISSQEAFIDDYAALIQAYLFLQEITGTSDYLLKAKAIAEKVINDFGDEDTVLFNFTNKTQTDNIIKKREIYDGATPSGNAVMADNLLKLSLLFDVPAWRNRAFEMVGGMRDMAVKYPASFGFWCLDLQGLVVGIEEIAILGKNYNQIAVDILAEYAPLKLLQSAANQTDEWPLLRGKPVNERKTMIFVCQNYQCQQPVETLDQFRSIISQNIFNKKSTCAK